ncbi:MAG: hypothetical protein K0U74_12080 [Alphaproteobacteria bacterium]|nr:hypothetical protein [Alphaproteobacteria bacterium]
MPNKLYVIDFKKHKDVLNFDINAGLGHLAYKQSMQRHTEDVLFYLCHKTFEYDEGLKEWGDGW